MRFTCLAKRSLLQNQTLNDTDLLEGIPASIELQKLENWS
jgi:hypothetical protein